MSDKMLEKLMEAREIIAEADRHYDRADELELLFTSINGVIEKYPEVWEAQKNAQLLHPKHLAILAAGFGKKY